MTSFYSNLTESLYKNGTLRGSGKNGRFYPLTRKKSFYFAKYFAASDELAAVEVESDSSSPSPPEECDKWEEFQKSVIEKQKWRYSQLLDAILKPSDGEE